MSPIKDKHRWVLQHVVILIFLTQSCGGQHQMIGPTQPVVAMIGDDIILPCHLEPAVDVVDLTVDWSRTDLKPRSVYVRREGVELLTEHNPLYTGRTSLSVNKLQCGDVSLKLSTVQLSDAGTYKCLVPKFNAETVVTLAVGSVSSPVIELTNVKNKMVLECKSNGWYPEPQMLWVDSEGKPISVEPTKNVRGSDGLYSVSSKVTVEKGQSYSFTCKVQQKNISQIKEANIHVSGDLFMVQSNTAVHIIVNLAVCLISFGTVILLIWKCGQKKTKIKTHDEDENELYQTELKGKCEENKRLEDELQNKEEDLKHVRQTIEKLMEQKTCLKNQGEKLNTLLQEDKTEMKEIRSETISPLSLEKDKQRQKLINKETDLEKRTEVHEELLKMTEKLIEETDNIIIQMTERKGKLENDKQQIIKHLREKQKEIEEIQKKLSEKRVRNNEQLSMKPG
ncbi:butyrophilin subfamily 3 member A2 [Oreochromis niloticus]|uniref:Butyrophilin subfamily 3 member A2 n=1 Tax=Oreochromis niloticus TaxID=8128 RepID=A0A669EKB5_ORENI|nr:butyrophilin subfamily 3 member A2 [Oreochromis niloticus]XP_019209419.1 butyrophilin subfamily 3 member A2 [Oreochromis niloticus]XP_025758938.1 butyrophilin subfamily 3 member A2 [Oreochromis niloticus]XP_025758941.1 butyrophilin subfamily 3 member A2 [Oreochromis niloticus]XP_025758943.1 butyrophilin subfamily 3 member A2 [Oreochromis niloticus]